MKDGTMILRERTEQEKQLFDASVAHVRELTGQVDEILKRG